MSLTDHSQQPPQATRKGEGISGSGNNSRLSDRETTGRGNQRDRNFRGGSRDRREEPEADNDVALALVTRAANTIDVLQSRCNQLDADANELRERLKTETETAERVIKDWERLATAMKAQLQECETRIAGLQERLEAAEARAEASETRAEAAEQQATVEEEIASSLREKILSAFASGSPTQTAIDSIVSGGSKS